MSVGTTQRLTDATGQVRVEGQLTEVTAAEADAYHATRPRQSQIAAWASAQSAPIADRTVLEAKVAEMEKRFAGGIAEGPAPRKEKPAAQTGWLRRLLERLRALLTRPAP